MKKRSPKDIGASVRNRLRSLAKERGKDIGASVRNRLRSLAKERGEDFQFVLTRYTNERLLFRLAQSQHGSRFVLKGATLSAILILAEWRL